MSLRDLAYKIAQEEGINPDLFVRQIEVESAFNPEAKSSAGAMGLAQLMPATAKELGVANPFDPEQSLRGGARYMKQLLGRYNNNQTLAHAAYNAGMGNVDKAGGVPNFKETQNYIAKILGGNSMIGAQAPQQMAQQEKPRGLLGGMIDRDFADQLYMAALAGSPNAQRFQPLIQQVAAGQQTRRAEEKLSKQINKTEQFLRQRGRDDLADAMLTGALDPSSAITAAVKPTADTAFEAKFSIYKNAMPNATDQEILAAMEGGPNTPAAIRELEIRAERAGLVAGTKEYEEFFRTAGLSDEAAAKAAGKAGGEAMVQAAGAKEDVDYATQLIDDLLNDPALNKVVGPLQGALPNVSADAVRVQAKIDRLSGQAFIAARQMLKGGGQITDFESKRAEAAYSLLMNTRLSDEDYRAALMEFKDAVQAGYNRLMAQAEAGGASSPQAPAETQAPNNDPLGIRG